MSAAFAELRAAAVPVKGVCVLVGRARATHHRHVRGPVHGPRLARVAADNGQGLTSTEQAAVLTLINTPGVRGSVDRPDLGEGTRRGPLPVLSLEHVPDRP